MTVLTFEVVGIPQKHVIEQPIEILGFGGSASLTIGNVNNELVVGPSQSNTRFHIIAHTSYHFTTPKIVDL